MKKASEILTFYFEVIKNSQEVAKKKKKKDEIMWTRSPASPSVDTFAQLQCIIKTRKIDGHNVINWTLVNSTPFCMHSFFHICVHNSVTFYPICNLLGFYWDYVESPVRFVEN